MLLVAGRRQYRVIDWLIDWLHNNDVEINWNGQNVNNNIDFDYANLAIFGFYENSVLDVGPLF